MPMTFDGSGTITGLAAGGLPNSSVTAADLATGAARANFGAGAVLQVVQAYKSDTFTTTSGSFTTITGLSASLTPSSSSNKILVIVNVTGSQQVNTNDAYIALYRGETQISLGDSSGSRIQSSAQLMMSNAGWSGFSGTTFLDSPATTSQVTYTVRARTANGGTLYINRGNSDSDAASGAGRTVSSITLMEIAG
jgi:hypothetical protein